MPLRRDSKLRTFDAQLSKDLIQRRGADVGVGDVGHGVQTSVYAMSVTEVKTVHAAWQGMAFKDGDSFAKIREADSSA